MINAILIKLVNSIIEIYIFHGFCNPIFNFPLKNEIKTPSPKLSIAGRYFVSFFHLDVYFPSIVMKFSSVSDIKKSLVNGSCLVYPV